MERLTRLHHVPGDLIRLNGRGAPSVVKMRAAVDFPLPRPPVSATRSIDIYREPRRSFAARTVFCINIAIVSAPTPPGTGV